MLVTCRNGLYRLGVLRSFDINARVVVVGNLTVGGTGKTPLVIALAHLMRQLGRKPGIITRGYGGKCCQWPLLVTEHDVVEAGDEAVLLASRSGAVVIADPDRVRAARLLVNKHGCDTVISDDGFQHFRMRRDIDIVVIDGERRLGNGWCLPSGPLREPKSALKRAEIIVNTGNRHKEEYTMISEIIEAVNMHDECRKVSLESFRGRTVHAIAAIGNPQRFFRQLEELGMIVKGHAFQDHHFFKQDDFDMDDIPILMTEKDAVKCHRLKLPDDCWYVPMSLRLDEELIQKIKTSI